MKKFESIDEYYQIVSDTQKSKLKNINCYLLPNEINDLIKNSRIGYLADDNTLQIIVDYDRLVKVYFYGNEDFDYLDFDAQKPIVTDLPYVNEKDEKFHKNEKKLKDLGFAFSSSSTRMAYNNFDMQKCYENDLTIDKMRAEDVDYVYKIWEENFDPVHNLLFSKDEIIDNMDTVYVLRDKCGRVAGVTQLIVQGNMAWIQKIAIGKSHQGCGLGGVLEQFCLTTCKSLGIKKILLYTVDGTTASTFHQKFGFVPDGKFNCQYIKGENKWKN